MKLILPKVAPVAATVIAALCLSACSSSSDSSSTAQTVEDRSLASEAVDGDITDDPNNPLPLQLDAGRNRISASTVAPDVEYITVNVPQGMQISALEVDSYESVDPVMFVGIQSGSVFTEPATNTNVQNLLGYSHFGAAETGTDILALVGAGDGAQGFSGALEAGDYTLWLQQTGSDVSEWEIALVVVEVGG